MRMDIRNWFPHLAIAATAGLLSLASDASAQKAADPPRIVTWNCSGCHGVDGNAQLPEFPRLAALNASYIEQRVATFRSAPPPPVDELVYRIVAPAAAKKAAAGSSREALAYMVGIAHAATGAESKDAAAWYASQKAAPGRSANPALVDKGKALFVNGLPAQGVIACQDCHGAQAQGMATFPRLGGQNSAYLVRQLQLFRAGERGHAPEMTSIAQHLDSEQSRAVAAFLQSR
jgi:cytochrome c553